MSIEETAVRPNQIQRRSRVTNDGETREKANSPRYVPATRQIINAVKTCQTTTLAISDRRQNFPDLGRRRPRYAMGRGLKFKENRHGKFDVGKATHNDLAREPAAPFPGTDGLGWRCGTWHRALIHLLSANYHVANMADMQGNGLTVFWHLFSQICADCLGKKPANRADTQHNGITARTKLPAHAPPA
jgi:hypothetical protein